MNSTVVKPGSRTLYEQRQPPSLRHPQGAPTYRIYSSAPPENPVGACKEPFHIAPETRHYLLDSLPNTVIEYCKRPNGVEKIPG